MAGQRLGRPVPKTARHYESVWKVHLSSSIGRRKIASLSPYDVERFYRSLKERGLSQAGVRQVKAVLHRSLRLAQKWSGGALHNPAADADLPAWRLEERRNEVRAPEVAEVRTLIAAAEVVDIRFGVFGLGEHRTDRQLHRLTTPEVPGHVHRAQLTRARVRRLEPGKSLRRLDHSGPQGPPVGRRRAPSVGPGGTPLAQTGP